MLIPTPSLLLSRRGRGKYQNAQLLQCPLLDLLNLLALDQDPFQLGQDQDPFQLDQEQDLCLLLDQGLVWKIRCQGVLVLAMEDQDQHLQPDQAQDQDQTLQQEQDQDQVKDVYAQLSTPRCVGRTT